MDMHITSGDGMHGFLCGYVAEIFQYAVHYIFANFKMMSNPALKLKFLKEICIRPLENIYHLHKCSG
jgi:hypothetical protein